MDRLDVLDALIRAFPDASTFVVFTRNDNAVEYLSRIIPFKFLVLDESSVRDVAKPLGLDLSRPSDMDVFVFGALFQSFSHVAALGCGNNAHHDAHYNDHNDEFIVDLSCSALTLLDRPPIHLPAI